MMTLPFIGRSLKGMGMEATRTGDSYYVDLGNDSRLIIGFRRGRISVAVEMPAAWDAVEELLFLASLTMARTTLTKVFLNPKDEKVNIWFSAESLCKKQGEFVAVFDTLFKEIMKSVRTFVGIRNYIMDAKEKEAMAEIKSSRTRNQQLN